MVRNDNFVAEAANMGHGLQMWLQTMWFLSRANPDSTVILDEPDVYMHPDLQRRLVRHLRNYSRQIVVTTHSVEIMSEVEPDEILILDKRQQQSNFATSLPAVQKLLDHVGSAQNLQLTRLWHARKIVFVEGKDFRLLSDIFDVIFQSERDGLFSIPNIPIGGWGGMAVHSWLVHASSKLRWGRYSGLLCTRF
jgi:predicted ATP-dependent endonuclease of OLD family